MKELIIDYFPASDTNPAQLEVSYRPEQTTEPQKSDRIDFAFEMTNDERELIQWYMEEYLLYPYGAYVDRANKAEKLIRQKGEELFTAVFSDQRAFGFYVRILDDITNSRIIVHASDSVGRSLPWELMCDPNLGYLAQKAYSFVRSRQDVSLIPVPLEPDQVINILMVICRPGGKSDVKFQSVARPLLEIFREHRNRINLEVLRPPTFEKLTEVLAQKPGFYHVIHFDLHGMFLEGTPGTGILYGDKSGQGILSFEKEDGGKRVVSGKELRELLKAKSVPLVMLNACQSGMTEPEAVYPSLGDELLNTGARGVVAMAYSVFVKTAARFMAKVYEMLVNGMTLERAVSAGREILSKDNLHESPIGQIPLQDWSVPVLFQSGEVKLFKPSDRSIHLVLKDIEDEQARAGAEIDLPEPPDFGFIGRDTLILDMERAFRNETIVLLKGMAGMGKSTAAVGFARWWAETGGLDGPIFFFDFQNYLPLAQVYDRVGNVFGRIIKEQLEVEWHLLDDDKRKNLALQVLRTVPCLMIWDNFETVRGFPTGTNSSWTEEEQDDLKSFLRQLMGGKTKVIITSRRDESWLGSCYRLIETSGLNMLESIELAGKVLDRAGVSRKKLKPYDELLKYLQGNPLAIQVILPELKRTEPDELLRALRSGEAKMQSDDESLGRTKSLTASLNYRLEHLDPELREKLGILGLFQGFVDTNVLAFICAKEDTPSAIKGLDAQTWGGILNSAQELGLLSGIGQGFYRIHPALPWFFRDAMEETFPNQREKLEKLFVRNYGVVSYQLFKMFETNAQIVVLVLRLEESNLMHALRLARQYEDWDSVNGILHGLTRLMDVTGRWTEWERLVSEVESDVSDENGEPIDGRESLWRVVLGYKAKITFDSRNLDQAEQIIKRLQEYDEKKAGDKWQRKEDDQLTQQERSALRNVGVALHQLGMIAQERRDFEEAEERYKKSLAIRKKIGDEHGQASTLHQLGIIAQKRWQFEEAEDWYRKSLEIEKKIGAEYIQATTLHQLGMIAQVRQQFDKAENLSRSSLVIRRKIGDENGQAQTLHQLGNIAYLRRDFEEAENWYRRSLAIEEKIGDEYSQAKILHQLGMIAEERRDFEEAKEWYQKSLEIKEKIGNEHGQAITRHQLGMIAEERGKFDEAEKFYLNAEEIVEPLNDPYHLNMVRQSLERVRSKMS